MSTSFEASSGIPNWSASYSQFLARSGAQSLKTLKLYQETLECMAQGRLSPTAFQDYYPHFVQAHTAEYSIKLAEVGARFLSDLVNSGKFFSPEPNGLDAAPKAEPEVEPPQFDPANPARWYEQLAEYAGYLNNRAVKAYRSQLDRVAAGEVTPTEVQQTTSEQLSRHLPDYLQHLLRIYFDLLNGLHDLRAGYEESYFSGLLAGAKPDHAHPPVILNLSGPLGSTAAATLSIANTTDAPTTLTYSVSDVRRLDGEGPAINPNLMISPVSTELAAGAEQTMTVQVPLKQEDYDPGAVYGGVLYISGNRDLRVEVQLRITAVAVNAADSTSASQAS